MVFHHLDDHVEDEGRSTAAEAVTCDHAGVDAIASVLALTDPERADTLRRFLIEAAAAGDYLTARDRQPARAAMAIRTLTDPHRSPIGAELADLSATDQLDALVARGIPILLGMAADAERHRDLWILEDQHLRASEGAFERGDVRVVEHPIDHLSVVTLAPHVAIEPPEGLTADYLVRSGSGHGGHWPTTPADGGLHPMVFNRASRGTRQLLVRDRHYRYVDRPESWFQYPGRVATRVDLRPIALDLNFLEGSEVWSATPPSIPVAGLATTEPSTLDLDTVLNLIVRQLRTAPVAWSPEADTGPSIGAPPSGWTRG